jgi:predicted MPP superfamily phosphohydrolase
MDGGESKPGASRRRFLRLLLAGVAGIPAACLLDAFCIEPHWLKTRRLRLTSGPPTLRLAHFTDLHHRGDTKMLQALVRRINAYAPDLVCFTGDLVEEDRFTSEALDHLKQIRSPLYGIPGNHDFWADMDFRAVNRAFEATGGRWLMDETVAVAGGKANLIGLACKRPVGIPPKPGMKNIILFHYPFWTEKLGGHHYDLALAGHSHGGQVCIPFHGPLIQASATGRYNLGLFETPNGPLYVGAGVGWFAYRARFFCRPEVAFIEM